VPFGSAKVKGAMARIFSIRRQAGHRVTHVLMGEVELGETFFLKSFGLLELFFEKNEETYNYY